MIEKIKSHLQTEVDAINNLRETNIQEIVNVLKNAKGKSRVFICGNGGSSCTAEHFASDLIKYSGFDFTHVFCLSDNVALFTAYSNDDDYSRAMKNMIENSISEDDILFVISVSGTSKNIVNAMNIAREKNAKIVALTGEFDNKIEEIATNYIKIQSTDYKIVELVAEKETV